MKKTSSKRKLLEEERIKSKTKISDGNDCYSQRSLCDFNVERRKACLCPDNDSEPDRSNPAWKILLENLDLQEESKQEIIDDGSGDAKKIPVWEEIMREYEDTRALWDSLNDERKEFEPELPKNKKLTGVEYLQKFIFPLLCPILEETLAEAKKIGCLKIQKCRFNGLDYISELLWNRNPLHSNRHGQHLNIFDIPFVRIWLKEHPRPIYPLSWLWSEEEAITVLQSYIRRYLVCSAPECSEMRQFWRIIKAEKEEECRLRTEMSQELTEQMFDEIFNTIISDAVFKVEWKRHGCKCLTNETKACHCECKCFHWCTCCNCFKKSHRKPTKKSLTCNNSNISNV